MTYYFLLVKGIISWGWVDLKVIRERIPAEVKVSVHDNGENTAEDEFQFKKDDEYGR